jgi:DNA invertase Pin-like site-specific DNA recombinase
MSELHIYSRVSSTVQEEDGTSLDTQKAAGERLAKQLGFTPILWNEGGQSSASEDLTNRPILRKLLERVNDGQVQYVFVYNTDRLSRNEATWSVIRLRLVKAKVTLHTSGGVFNLSNPMDKMLLGIMSEFSTYDNAIRSERSLLGKNERVKQGFWLGGPPPFGYRLESKKLVEEPKESKWVKFIYESYKDKWTTRAIRQELMRNGVLTRRGNVAWSLGSIEK